ncbi:hypothetical protein CBR_g6590 [Chara braunii]|uniref:Uncharacterized protein n=1 Tax=Chara braunii TaxID=69332 RepID=A0A388KK78_CHABU|nr:hypothetical protein CBR_g6590 [Chara braunii]|eukprot:GBG70462.1 hypothetical protein CBR_g6590 [Chara braunii]
MTRRRHRNNRSKWDTEKDDSKWNRGESSQLWRQNEPVRFQPIREEEAATGGPVGGQRENVTEVQEKLSKTSITSHSKVRWGSEVGEYGMEQEFSQRPASSSSSSVESSAASRLKQGLERKQTVDKSRRTTALDRNQMEAVQRCLVPILCLRIEDITLFLSLVGEDGSPVIPLAVVDCCPTPTKILEVTKQLYGEHVPVRLIPHSIMESVILETVQGYVKMYFPLLDVRIPPEVAGILLHRDLQAQVIDAETDVWGRWAWMKAAIGNEEWVFMTVYAPTDAGERARFFKRLMHHIPVAEKLVLAGDWNVSLDDALRPGSPTADRQDVRGLLEFCSELELADPFPVLNPNDPGYTWVSHLYRDRQAVTRRRLDFFLLGEELQSRVTAVRQVCDPLSDHKPVVTDLRMQIGVERGKGFFRLNSQVQETPGVREWMTDHMRKWEEARRYFENAAQWLDGGLAIAIGVLDVISRTLARERNRKEADCKRRVEEAELRMEGHPISAMVWAAERERRLSEWDNLQPEKEKRWTELLKVKGIETNDKMSKETFQRLQPSRTHHQMIELRHPFDAAAPPACSALGMLHYASLYYADILTTRRPQDDVNSDLSVDSDMWDDTSVRLQTTARLDLDRPITMEETRQTLKSMAKGKSPGVDGLMVEFYSANWEALGRQLVEVYDEVLTGGRLGKGMTHGIISVLFKKGDKAEVRNWRPISLLNVSYKILAKTLARRLARYLPDLIEKDQGAFVQGRSIFNNIVTAIETLEIVQREELDTAGLLLDLEKAYDKVGWAFTLTTLRRMDFGRGFCAWVIAMYTLSTSAVMINGHVSEAFPLLRSLRQGCPLAPLVFVLQLEVLLNKIRRHPNIRGLELHRGEECRVKALADDLFAAGGCMGMLVLTFFQEEEIEVSVLGSYPESLEEGPPGCEVSTVYQGRSVGSAILDQSGESFAANGATGLFGLSWIKRGVVRIADIWSTLLGTWAPVSEIKASLRGLHRVEEHRDQIINAIPQSWLDLLGPEGLDPPGTWYTSTQEEEANVVWKVTQITESGFRKVERWKCEGPRNTLSFVEEEVIRVWDNPAQIRVVVERSRRPAAEVLTWIGKVPLRKLCIDPTAWGWYLRDYTVSNGYRLAAVYSLSPFSLSPSLQGKVRPLGTFIYSKDRSGGGLERRFAAGNLYVVQSGGDHHIHSFDEADGSITGDGHARSSRAAASASSSSSSSLAGAEAGRTKETKSASHPSSSSSSSSWVQRGASLSVVTRRDEVAEKEKRGAASSLRADSSLSLHSDEEKEANEGEEVEEGEEREEEEEEGGREGKPRKREEEREEEEKEMRDGTGRTREKNKDVEKQKRANRPIYQAFSRQEDYLMPKMYGCARLRNPKLQLNFDKWRWQPQDCSLPEFNGEDFLNRLVNKTVAFVGDSLASEQLLSLMYLVGATWSEAKDHRHRRSKQRHKGPSDCWVIPGGQKAAQERLRARFARTTGLAARYLTANATKFGQTTGDGSGTTSSGAARPGAGRAEEEGGEGSTSSRRRLSTDRRLGRSAEDGRSGGGGGGGGGEGGGEDRDTDELPLVIHSDLTDFGTDQEPGSGPYPEPGEAPTCPKIGRRRWSHWFPSTNTTFAFFFTPYVVDQYHNDNGSAMKKTNSSSSTRSLLQQGDGRHSSSSISASSSSTLLPPLPQKCGKGGILDIDSPVEFLKKNVDRFDVIVISSFHHWHERSLMCTRVHAGGVPMAWSPAESRDQMLAAMATWLDEKLDHERQLAFVRSFPPNHFVNGAWNTGGSCHHFTALIGQEELRKYAFARRDEGAEKAVEGTRVQLLNITYLSSLRPEAHPADRDEKNSTGPQDCVHWCLPGIPDVWNEMLYARLVLASRSNPRWLPVAAGNVRR